MYNYEEKIKEFLQHNFTPSTAEKANVKLTTNGLLKFLWNTFPKDCISDYTLVQILEELNYKQTMYVIEDTESAKTQLTLGWCFETPFDFDEVKE